MAEGSDLVVHLPAWVQIVANGFVLVVAAVVSALPFVGKVKSFVATAKAIAGDIPSEEHSKDNGDVLSILKLMQKDLRAVLAIMRDHEQEELIEKEVAKRLKERFPPKE